MVMATPQHGTLLVVIRDEPGKQRIAAYLEGDPDTPPVFLGSISRPVAELFPAAFAVWQDSCRGMLAAVVAGIGGVLTGVAEYGVKTAHKEAKS